MNTNSNTYTVIYSIILVVVVAAVLAFTAITLQPKQETNVKVETISKILTTVGLYNTESQMSNEDILKTYSENIQEAVLVNFNGEVSGQMSSDVNNIEIKGQSDLKAQNDIMKKINAGDEAAKSSLKLPVYVFNVNGEKITVVPCYGAGLWGPIWGYLAFDKDMNTIDGAVFDHKGETPGLGAEIATNWFRENFKGKKINDAENNFVSIEIVKGGAADDDINGVDAISGGTITSDALEKAIDTWLRFYVPYFNNQKTQDCACDCCGEEHAESVNNVEE